MEVYLNVAEMDEGVFGVEAAARAYWGLSAADLGPQRAARLMAVLPDPKRRSPVSGSRFVTSRGAAIQRGAETIRQDGRGACFL
jgi:monofunctional biosynthetic peptidoglycan transglycosylase